MKKGTFKTPEHLVKQAVQRKLAGEPAPVLAKEYGVSRAQIYNWVDKHRENEVNQARRNNMSAADSEKADKRDLLIEKRALEKQVRDLKETIFQMEIART